MLTCPFPWFGGKSKVSDLVWERFGDVRNYVEPFAGSLAVLLGRPSKPRIETVNDKDSLICNFWRAIKNNPSETAKYADNPIIESDLHARHLWLKENIKDLRGKLEADINFFDCKVAGWWCWGLCSWIGNGWCGPSGGAWSIVDGKLEKVRDPINGINRQRPHLGDKGQGINKNIDIYQWFIDLANRLERVRVVCGDWERVLGPSSTTKNGMTGVFLDPPYSADRDDRCYREDEKNISNKVREWVIENCSNSLMRIALCGYAGEHNLPGWECIEWKTNGGLGNYGKGKAKENKNKERIWFSPNCLENKENII